MGEKTANHVSGQGPVSRIYNGLLELNNKRTNMAITMGEDLNRHISKGGTQMANKLLKR